MIRRRRSKIRQGEIHLRRTTTANLVKSNILYFMRFAFLKYTCLSEELLSSNLPRPEGVAEEVDGSRSACNLSSSSSRAKFFFKPHTPLSPVKDRSKLIFFLFVFYIISTQNVFRVFNTHRLESAACRMGTVLHHVARAASGDTSDKPCDRNAEVLVHALRSDQTHLHTLGTQGPRS